MSDSNLVKCDYCSKIFDCKNQYGQDYYGYKLNGWVFCSIVSRGKISQIHSKDFCSDKCIKAFFINQIESLTADDVTFQKIKEVK